MEFLFTLWYPKGSKKNWPKCHSGQSVSGQSVSGQSVIGQSVTSQSDTDQTVSPAKVSLAKVSLAKWSLWPKSHSGQSVIQAILDDSSKIWQIPQNYCGLWQAPRKAKSGRLLSNLEDATLAGVPL